MSENNPRLLSWQIWGDFSAEEGKTIKSLPVPSYIGRCSCAIQDKKPTHCRLGPFLDTLVPGCGFYFRDGERKGQCNRCGACCVIPRVEGNPYGVYDAKGKPCRHLIIDEPVILYYGEENEPKDK